MRVVWIDRGRLNVIRKRHIGVWPTGERMNLQEAIEEYATMVIVGADAILRLVEREPGQTSPDLLDTLDALIDQAEHLKASSSHPSDH